MPADIIYPLTLPQPSGISFTGAVKPASSTLVFASGRSRTSRNRIASTGGNVTLSLTIRFTLSEYLEFTAWWNVNMKPTGMNAPILFRHALTNYFAFVPTGPVSSSRAESSWTVTLKGYTLNFIEDSAISIAYITAAIGVPAAHLANIAYPTFGGTFEQKAQDIWSTLTESNGKHRATGVDRFVETTLSWTIDLREAMYLYGWYAYALLFGAVPFVLAADRIGLGSIGDRNTGTLLARAIGAPSMSMSGYFGKFNLPVSLWYRQDARPVLEPTLWQMLSVASIGTTDPVHAAQPTFPDGVIPVWPNDMTLYTADGMTTW